MWNLRLKNIFLTLPLKPTQANSKQLFIHYFLYMLRPLHLSTQKGQTYSVEEKNPTNYFHAHIIFSIKITSWKIYARLGGAKSDWFSNEQMRKEKNSFKYKAKCLT